MGTVIKMAPCVIIVLGCQRKRGDLFSWAKLSSSFLLLLFSPGWLTTATLDWTRLVSSLYLQSSSSVGNCGRGNFTQIWVVLCFLNISPSQMSGQTRGLNILRTVHSQKAKNIIKSIINISHFNHCIKKSISSICKYSLFFSFLHN